MPARTGNAEWKGDLQEGAGTLALGSGAFDGAYSFKSRFADEAGTPGTNPEELIAAAHAACFSMALSAALSGAGNVPESVRTTATVRLEKQDAGFAITRIDLSCQATVPGIDDEAFQKIAADAKANCPVSKALAAVDIELEATLAGS